jgi:hypothetical protein
MASHRINNAVELFGFFRVRAKTVTATVSPIAIAALCARHNNTASVTGSTLVLLNKVSSFDRRQYWDEKKKTNRTRSMKHADAEIPQEEPAVITDAAKSIGLLVTTPRIKRDRGNEGIVSLAASDDFALGERPDSEKVVLATSHNVFTVGRPANADYTTVVAAEDVQNPVMNWLVLIYTVGS